MSQIPHLPPKTCNIQTHKRLQRLPLLLFVAFLSFLAGISGGLASITWISPPAGPASRFTPVSRTIGDATVEMPNPLLENEMKQQMIGLFDTRKKIGSAWYKTDGRIADAVLLTDNGWAVAALPAYKAGDELSWEGVDFRGNTFSVEEVKKENIFGLVFLRFSGNQFVPVSFSDVDNMHAGSIFWAVAKQEWTLVDVSSRVSLESPSGFLVWKPHYEFVVSSTASEGQILFTLSGEFAGFVGSDGHIIPATFIPGEIQSVLTTGTFLYEALPYAGLLVEGFSAEDAKDRLFGFLVTGGVLPKSSPIQKNDLIIGIEGKPIDPLLLHYQVLRAPKTMTLTILRGKEEIDVMVSKVLVEP